jgi:uncharacterized protein YgiB involved in biofilm formation
LQTWDVNNQPTTAGETYNDALTGITSAAVRFGIYATDGAVDDLGIDYDFHIDNFEVKTAPVCNDVTAVTIDSVTADSATVSWTENSVPVSTAWEVVAVPAGDPAPAVGTSNATTNPYTITSLTANTSYDVYVRADCSTTFVGPISLTTVCTPLIAPYTEDFELFTTSPSAFASGNCWSGTGGAYYWESAPGNDTGSGRTGPDLSITTGNYFYTEASAGTAGDTTDLVSPLVDLTALTAPALSFNYHMFGGQIGTLDVLVNGATNVWTLSGQQQTTATTPWQLAVVDLTAYAGQTISITIRGTRAGGFEGDIAIDDVSFNELPACSSPNALTATNIDGVSADLGWTENGTATAWNVELVDITAMGIATGTATNTAVANPFNITGLTAENDYEFYVQADCGVDGTSIWIGPLTFRTPCTTLIAPYTEDFELFTTSPSAFASGNCWSGTGGSYYWESAPGNDTGSVGTGPDPSITTGNYFYTEATFGTAGDTTDLVSPLVDLTALTAPALSFNYHMFGGQIGTLDVLVNGATNVWTLSGQQQTTATTPWELAVVDLTAYAGQTISITFRATSAGIFEGDIAIDDVSFNELPVCNDVTAVTIDSVTADSATVSWTENSVPVSTAWEVVAVPAGDPAPAVGTSNATSNPFTIPSLMGITSYDIYVRADCSAAFVAPITATTNCPVFIPDTFEAFTTFIPDCWEVADGGDLSTGPTNFGTSQWFAEEFAHVGTGNGAVNINLYRAIVSDWIVSPVFDLSAGGYELNLDVALTDYNNSNSDPDGMDVDDQVILAYTLDGATWTALQTWDINNQPSNTGDTYNDALTGINGATVTFGIYATEGAIDGGFDYDFHIDNFQLRTPPTCPDTSNLTLVSNTDVTAAINFDSGNATSAGNYEYSLTTAAATAPAVSGSWTDVAGATPNVTYTIMGLTAETEYFVYVREVCAIGDESAWSFVPINLTTACAAFTAPYTEDFENAGAVPNCWRLGGDENWLFNTSGPNHVGNAGTLSGSTASGNYYAVLDDSTPDAADGQLNSPLVDVSGLSSPALTFYEISDNEGNASATLTVSVWDGAAWNVMGTYNTNTAGWELKIIDLSALTFTGAAQARFSIADSGSFYDDIAIDDVSFNELPTCSNVNAVTVDSVTGDSVTVSWTENNMPAGTAWEVIAVPTGDPVPSVGTTNTTAIPYTVTGLVSSTAYDIYVRADCSTTFVGPLTGTTSCAIVTTYPYTTDFTNNVPNACWEEAGSGEIVDGPMTVGSSDWRANRSYENFAGTAIPSNAINLYFNNYREWLLSEQYDMTGTSNDVLSIEVAVTNWNSVTVPDVMGSDDQVDLLITTDAGMTWTSLMTWTAANQPAVDGTREFIDLSSYTGTVQFAFFASDGVVNDSEDYDFHVGMFIIDGTAGNEDVFASTLSLYPNPVNGDVVTISMDQASASSIEVAVFNTLGQQVMTRSYDQVTNSIQIDNLSSLSKGMYFVKISKDSQEATLKFIKE